MKSLPKGSTCCWLGWSKPDKFLCISVYKSRSVLTFSSWLVGSDAFKQRQVFQSWRGEAPYSYSSAIGYMLQHQSMPNNQVNKQCLCNYSLCLEREIEVLHCRFYLCVAVSVLLSFCIVPCADTDLCVWNKVKLNWIWKKTVVWLRLCERCFDWPRVLKVTNVFSEERILYHVFNNWQFVLETLDTKLEHCDNVLPI